MKFLFLVMVSFICVQSYSRGHKSHFIQEPDFLIYTCKTDISVYLLARILRHPVDSIQVWNPGLPSYLPSGTEIRTRPADPSVKAISHIVDDERSSLKDLALLYGTDQKDLKAINPQIRNRVWFGQQVKIPVLEEGAPEFRLVVKTGIVEAIKEEKDEEDLAGTRCRKDPRNLKSIYKVALLVPLSLEEVVDIDTSLAGTPAQMMNMPSFRFIQYYQGFLMAADMLEKKGLNLELSVYDIDQDNAKTEALVGNPKLKDMDLIVGPFYKNSFSIVSGFASNNHIPILNPLSSREDILKGNPVVFKAVPSRMSQLEGVTKLVDHRFGRYNILLVTENKYQGRVYVDSLRNSLESLLQRPVPLVDYDTDSIPGLEAHLSFTLPNLVIIYAESEVLPVELLPLLNELTKETEITIVGLPEWEKFEQLENKYLMNLKAYFFSERFVDYLEPEVKQFIASFRERYLAEPLKYAYDGFDAGYFFLSAMMDYGRGFEDCIKLANYPLLQTSFHFKKTEHGGFDNTYWNIYHFQDYHLIQVSDFR